MNDVISVKFNESYEAKVSKGSSIRDAIELLPDNIKRKVIGVKLNKVIVDQDTKLYSDSNISILDSNDINGYKMMQAGLKFVLYASIKDVLGKDFDISFNHSILRGIHCNIIGNRVLTNEDISKIKNNMSNIIYDDLIFKKLNISSKEAYSYYKKIGDITKSSNIKNVSNGVVFLYKLKKYINYFYVNMPYSTGCLRKYDLVYLGDNELVLMFPNPRTNLSVPEYIHYSKIIDCYKQEKSWLNRLGIPYVYLVNEKVTSSNIQELIKLSEVNYDNHIHDAANEALQKGSRFIMIAGPSSSGKTTTCKKLSLTMESMGIKTVTVSTDDYFKDRCDTPKNEDGSYNFECLDAIDVDLLNNDINKLLNKESVVVPRYNFIEGRKEFDSDPISIDDNTIIIMEGLHCLNDELTYNIDSSVKYKIYLSPFMPLNIDRHNYISTTDLRLLRRIIRDNRTRGYDVNKTIDCWQSVRYGEEHYIFPFINQADKIINTSLVYELGVLKVFAEPLLYSVDSDSAFYEEARRLISFLKSYFPISSEYISNDCVLREFIGGSIFE